MCGTGPATDRRVAAIHARTQARLASLAGDSSRAATLREGAFYLQTDETITAGYRPLDLIGQSLVFTPSGGDAVTLHRDALRYVEPSGGPLIDFQTNTDAHFIVHDLPFSVPLFGENVTRIYVSAFNAIHTSEPPRQTALQFDALQAGVHRGAVLSPLMITTGKPRFLDYPRVWIDDAADGVVVTWRSSTNAPFGYDLQAKIAKDGTITYSYREVVAMRWGTPVLSRGFDPAEVSRTLLRSMTDSANDVDDSVPAPLRAMLDVRGVDSQRLAGADLFAVRVALGEAIDRTKLAEGEVLTVQLVVAADVAMVEIDRDEIRVSAFGGAAPARDAAGATIEGNVIEFYGAQRFTRETSARVRTYFGDEQADTMSLGIPFGAPPRSIVSDLSAVPDATTLPLPLAEPFVLGELDPLRVWNLVRDSYGISTYDYDAVAMYQSFYTDLIFYAGAYATRGNPQVDGIVTGRGIGQGTPRSPTLLHLNQLTYNYSATTERASQVMLHELGHRWLYYFNIMEGGDETNSLNPVSGHPAAYVHTPAAFPVWGANEASVMGGGYFTPEGGGSYRAHAANHGYSWTDLYIMGLAAPAEVPPWFYIAGTDFPGEYWPQEGAIATGERRDVEVGQIIAAHGPRLPSVESSQRMFRVLFVLVTENAEPTEAEVAKVNEWRALLERNFVLATGGRGRVVTTFVRPSRRRAS
jgi:hypothetical protein